MAKKAIIYDLDNTVYSVQSIKEKLFSSLFQLLESDGTLSERLPAIKEDLMRKPFQVVAREHQFSNDLMQKGLDLLKNLTYNEPIELHDDYSAIKKLPQERFLVTTGFTQLQHSKIRSMGIEHDFKEIHVIDPLTTDQTKRTIFADILKRYQYTPAEVLVVGDDPESELKAAAELGIDAVHYDKFDRFPTYSATYKITNFKELAGLV
jgi:putative hydrolase of the HAD superfamily